MDSETLLITISALFVKWKRTRQTLEKEATRRKLVKLIALRELLEAEEQRPRQFWVRPIFTSESRLRQGASDNLIDEMESCDHEKYVNYLRMTPRLFHEILAVVRPGLTRQTVVRNPIPAHTRLQMTLRYLASGDSMVSISFAFRIGRSTVSKIIFETCDEIWNCFKDSVFLTCNPENWKSVADSFEQMWNFPNCIGAIDGKHVVLQAPAKSGSAFYNYKGSHSLVMLACSDAHYRFTLLDIGAEGRQSDGGIFSNSAMARGFEGDFFHIPPATSVSSDGPILPMVLVADEAFALTKYMMRPYPRSRALNRKKKVFNYRLSRARGVVESAFGILAAKWRVYRRPIDTSVSTAKKIVQATCCLHNYILSHEAELPPGQRFYSTLTAEERQANSVGLADIEDLGPNARNQNAIRIREEYATFLKVQVQFPGNGRKPCKITFRAVYEVVKN